MDRRTLEDLRTPDERTLHLTPLGLGRSPGFEGQDALVHHHELLSGTDLVAGVAEGTRLNFERLRLTFVYGVLQYEFFTIAGQFARLVIEHALRDRFLAFHQDGLVLVNQKTSETRVQQVKSFEEVHGALKRRGGPWQLRLKSTGSAIKFNGMLASLWNWARAEGLLPGQRARSLQRYQVRLRNSVAHQSGYQLGTSREAALVIRDLAEVINCLWGTRTPDGRLHPAPVHRAVLVIAWDSTGAVEVGDLRRAPSAEMAAETTCVLVRAVMDDFDQLIEYDARFETTQYPTELLWGPGSAHDARAWFDANEPEGDEVDHLDRHFMVRRVEGRVELPRRAAVAAALRDDDRTGTWALVKADDPITAYGHVRNQAAGGDCSEKGPCGNCAVDTVVQGTWANVIECAARLRIDVDPVIPVDVRLPPRLAPGALQGSV